MKGFVLMKDNQYLTKEDDLYGFTDKIEEAQIFDTLKEAQDCRDKYDEPSWIAVNLSILVEH